MKNKTYYTQLLYFFCRSCYKTSYTNDPWYFVDCAHCGASNDGAEYFTLIPLHEVYAE